MDPNTLLLWMVGASCGVSLLLLVNSHRDLLGRLCVTLLVLGVMGISLWIRPEQAGYFAGAAFLMLMLLPGLAYRVIEQLIAAENFALAKRLSTVVAWIHPFDGGWNQPRMIDAIRLHFYGHFAASDSLLAELQRQPNSLGTSAALTRARQSGDWQGFLEWVASQSHRKRLFYDPQIVSGYLQGLGETGQRAVMFQEFDRLMKHYGIAGTMLLNVTRMKVAALAGEPALVERLFRTTLSMFALDIRQYWLATAFKAQGDEERAEKLFHQIVTAPGAQLTKAVHYRRHHPLLTQQEQPLNDFSLQVLREIQEACEHESHFAVLNVSHNGRTQSTWGVVVMLLIVFLFEMPDGSTNPDNLLDMGAMIVPLSASGGEWWRIFTAAFLHFGPLHLMMNVFGLMMFGQRLERAWGSSRMLVCYLTSAFASIALVQFFMPEATDANPAMLVGASGGVMGLIGGLLGHLSIGIMRGRNKVVSREFRFVFLIVALQMFFDANTPIVSSSCHLLGLACGFIVGLAVGFARKPASTTAVETLTQA